MTERAVIQLVLPQDLVEPRIPELSIRSLQRADANDIGDVKHTSVSVPDAVLTEVEKVANIQRQANAAQQLAEVINTLNCAIDQYGQFVLQTVVGHRSEVLLLESQAGQDAVRAAMKSVSGCLPGKTAVEKIIAEIRIATRASGRHVTTYQRIGRLGDTYVIDLGDPAGRAIHISNGHWDLVADSVCAFTRPLGYKQLPTPVKPKSSRHALLLLFNFLRLLGIPKSRIPLVIMTLVCWLKEGVTYPVLSLFGPAGSGKTTAAMLLLKLIDPPAKNQIPNIEQEVQHLTAAAQARHVLSFDNVSKFSLELQNTLCICSTGGEIFQRRLYTNGEAAVLPIHRPVLVTSVNPVITRADLLTRTVSMEFKTLDKRADIDSLVKEFEAQAGDLFGALLELVAASTVPLQDEDSKGNRLHDFCIAGQRVFAAAGIEPGKFMKFVDRMRASTGAEIASGDTFIIVLLEVLRGLSVKSTTGEQLPGWKSWFPNKMASVIGANGECLAGIRPKHLVNLVQAKPTLGFDRDRLPKNERELSGALHRVTPTLTDIGIRVSKREPSTGNSYWEFRFDVKQLLEDA